MPNYFSFLAKPLELDVDAVMFDLCKAPTVYMFENNDGGGGGGGGGGLN